MSADLLSDATLTTLTVRNGSSVATLDLKRKGDGSFEFTDVDGNVVNAHSNEAMRKLFDAVAVLE